MFDYLMKFIPDPLKALDDLLCVLRYGLGAKLTWAQVSGWPGARVESLLRRYGVTVYRRQYAFVEGDDYGVHVPRAQSRWAEYVLRRAGCPLTSPLLHAGNRNVTPGPIGNAWSDANPRAAARPAGLAGAVVAFLTRK